jgi:RNase H-like domain found in reverse transcriptase/Integrase zinc binding domain
MPPGPPFGNSGTLSGHQCILNVLQQRRPGSTWRPLGFFSAKLDNAQLRYSTFDRELLAVFQGTHYFRFMLEGRRFTVYTDYRPLVGPLHRISESWSARQQRQLSFISENTADMQHTPGSANIVADTLSRPAATAANISAAPPPAMPPPVNLAAAQAECPHCRRGRSSPALNVMQVQLPLLSGDGGAALVLVDTSSGVLRPLVPAAFRCRIFDAIHGLAHPGTMATKRLISSRYVWPQLASNIAAWCKVCEQCCRAKVTRQPAADPVAITVPTTRFSHIHVDLVGPCLPTAANHRQRMSGHPDRRLVLSVWHPGRSDHQQGRPVHRRSLVASIKPAGNQAYLHHHLSPPKQRAGGEISLPAERCAESASRRPGLASPPSLGSPRAACCTAGGLWPIRRRAGFRGTAESSCGDGQRRKAT